MCEFTLEGLNTVTSVEFYFLSSNRAHLSQKLPRIYDKSTIHLTFSSSQHEIFF